MSEINFKFLRKKENLLLIVGISIVALLLCKIPNGTGQLTDSEIVVKQQSQEAELKEPDMEYVDRLEKELSELLIDMEGVGRVRVLITLQCGEEYCTEEDMRVLKSGEPFVKKKNYPLIQGVAVVAEGAEIQSVKREMRELICTIFQIENYRVKIVTMKSK